MKLIVKSLFVGAFVVLVSGCASDFAYVPQVPPHARALLLDYEKLPDNKVFVIAVDPNGDFAAGYEGGMETREEAYKAAMNKCIANKKAYGVLAPAHVYDVNGETVYEKDIARAMSRE